MPTIVVPTSARRAAYAYDAASLWTEVIVELDAAKWTSKPEAAITT